MTQTDQQITEARQLLAGGLRGVLSTQSEKFHGYPFGSLVPYCLDYDGIPVSLLSHLSQHTRNLDADPKVALTISQQGPGDVQALARLTVLAEAHKLTNNVEAISSRYCRYFPTARAYFSQLNFRFYSLNPVGFYFVGGFGAARWFGIDRILRANPFTREDEWNLIQSLQEHHMDTLLLHITSDAETRSNADTLEFVVAGIDSLGLDVRLRDRLTRIPFLNPLTEMSQVGAIIATLGKKTR